MTNEIVSGIFAVPLYSRIWHNAEPVNAELKQMILERAPARSDRAWSNVGGWHSPADLQSWGGSAVDQLIQWIRTATREMTEVTTGLSKFEGDFTVWCWANLLRPGGYNIVHDHARSGWSGVYYVEPGEDNPDNPLAGQIEFIDPRVAVCSHVLPGQPFDAPVRVKPKAGQMMVFPGWLKHFVHTYEGQSERISISFNLAYKPPPGPTPAS